MIKNVEDLMYRLSDLFLAPVLLLLVAFFAYALFALGEFVVMAWQRRQSAKTFASLGHNHKRELKRLSGYPLAQAWLLKPTISSDELDVEALKHLEAVRTVSRLAPMLGLIATMIPMGPALKSLSNGNIQGISDNLIVAFSAVIFGLVIASITFWIASIKKRWLAVELVGIAAIKARSKGELREVA